jgi:hypothetical protein
MIDRFNAFIRARASGRNVLLWLGLTVFWIGLFGVILVPAFAAATSGYRPVDLALPTTPELIFEQLPLYTEASFRAYAWFAVFDFLYPPTLAMFFASFWAWMINRTPNRIFSALQAKGILVLPFLAALFDGSENIGFLIVIFNYPPALHSVAEVACAFKSAKVLVHAADISLTVMFGLTGLIVALRSRRGFS